jgi:hypothetical protein
MNIVNSIVRGFGSQIGRHTANKMLERNETKVMRVSSSLTFWQGIKTILWFIPMMMLSFFVNTIYNMIFNEHFLEKSYTPNFKIILFIAVLFTTIIGYGYYQENKKNLK